VRLPTAPAKLARAVEDTSQDYEVTPEDLEVLESRICEVERYLGIQDMDLAYFLKEEGEDLNTKSLVLDDFVNLAQDKFFVMKDLYAKYERMESFLKHQEPFEQQCMDLKRKA
jgi:hypothetical protein